jgi:hypothetical protein
MLTQLSRKPLLILPAIADADRWSLLRSCRLFTGQAALQTLREAVGDIIALLVAGGVLRAARY